MLKADQLPIVEDRELPDEEHTLQVLRDSASQHAQGWGLRLTPGVALRLARELKIALELASQAEQAIADNKGYRMREGKLKNKVEDLEHLKVAQATLIEELKAVNDRQRDELKAAKQAVAPGAD